MNIDEKAREYAYTEVKNSFPELKGNSARLIELFIQQAYIKGSENKSENIDQSSKDYAKKVVDEKLNKYPDATQRLISIFIRQSFVQACEDAGENVAIERIEIASELCSFN